MLLYHSFQPENEWLLSCYNEGMSIFVYDPTSTDSQSKVRGIGRFIQILKEILPKNSVFTSNLSDVSFDSVFINPFINLVQPPLITKRIAKKQIGIIHDIIPLQFPQHFPVGLRGKLNIWRNNDALKYYDLVITDSEASKKKIVEKLKVSESKLKVIFPTLPTIFNQEASIKKKVSGIDSPSYQLLDTKYFIYVGDVTWNKNLVNLAKAIKLGTLPCVFVGKTFTSFVPVNSWTSEFHEFMKIAKDDKRFAFPGFITDDQLKILYKNAIANILVSREEGFGFSYFEAASQKTPSILSNIETFHETSDEAALFVDINNPENITEAMKKISEDKTLRKSLGQKAFERSRSLPDSVAAWRLLLDSLQTQQ